MFLGSPTKIKKHKLTLELEDLNRQSMALDEKRKSLESQSLIENFSKKIEEKGEKTALPAKQCSKGFRGAYQCFSIKPSEKNLSSFVNFLLGSKKETKRLLREKLVILKNIKFNLVYMGYFVLGVGLSMKKKKPRNRSNTFIPQLSRFMLQMMLMKLLILPLNEFSMKSANFSNMLQVGIS